MKIYKLDNLPSKEEYIQGFNDIKKRISKNQLCLLQKQYYSPNKIVTATQLAELSEIKGGRPVVNSIYGRLGHLLADAIGLKPNQRQSGDYNWWSILSSGYVNKNNFCWQMYEEVALALEALGWVNEKLNINHLQELSDHILAQIEFDIDDRSLPDGRRWGQFKIGWQNAALKNYNSGILKTLTWNNLGYRFGKKLGTQSESEMRQVYDYLANLYITKNQESFLDFPEPNIENINYFDQKINNLLEHQNNVITILAETIQYCHNTSPDKWAIYYKSDQDKIRLIVGNLIVLTIEKRGIWLTLAREILEENEHYQDYLEKIDTWTWDICDYPSYSKVPSINGFYCPSENYLEDWTFIKKIHFEFIKKVNTKYTKINPKSKLNHQPELIKYLCKCLKTFVPQPDYYLNNSCFTFPEELSDETEITNLYEGAKQSITVNRYERNNQARKKCIEYYGTGCYVCGFNFEEIFGEIGQGFIHVHHLTPLSEISQEYEVDPIKDLRPVCPNCHAMIHRKNPPFTIEEIKKLLNINN